MRFRKIKKRIWRTLCLISIWPTLALASTDSGKLPWDGPLKTILDDLTGTTAMIISIIAIVVCGLGIMWGDLQGSARKGAKICLGVSIALGSASVIKTLFNASGAVI